MRAGPEGLRPAANKVSVWGRRARALPLTKLGEGTRIIARRRRKLPSGVALPRSGLLIPNVNPRLIINSVRCAQLDGAQSKSIGND
ncbi:hypothetical protein RB335 [Rhodopirellula baltica SH 1]|uniref:Uncharacterized protein n=1 Tax=Rhodopirellula baltica (strain DSM 10527 / NCIMB 13988 / SH1) TaxID=243090 RepID=Q7UYX2_RHOBA|nr:hypothetical protein RB335 [Rhodopirellula baltica SH 1]